jgi:hypothetical protein
MKLTKSELIYEADQNYIKATFFADETPNTMPVPADVPGCDSTWKFTPDSVLYVVGSGDLYLAGVDNAWHQQ